MKLAVVCLLIATVVALSYGEPDDQRVKRGLKRGSHSFGTGPTFPRPPISRGQYRGKRSPQVEHRNPRPPTFYKPRQFSNTRVARSASLIVDPQTPLVDSVRIIRSPNFIPLSPPMRPPQRPQNTRFRREFVPDRFRPKVHYPRGRPSF